MSYFQLGSGLLYLNPNAGNLVTNPTAVKPFTIQDIKFDQKGTIKELMGQSQYPDDTGAVDKKGTFEFSMGRKDYFLANQIFNADVVAAGGTSVVTNESHSASAPVTVAPPGSGTWATDLGVSFSSNNFQLTRIPSGTPATGQYTAAAGVYTFAAADTAKTVLISFAYTLASAGSTFQVNNQTQGWGPQFEAYIVDVYQPVSSVFNVVHLYACKINDISYNNKRADYAMVDLKGAFFAAANGRVIDFYSAGG